MVHSTSNSMSSMASTSSTSLSRYPDLETDRRRSRSKFIHLTGDLRLASSKARKRLGSEMSAKQRKRMMKFDKEEAYRRRTEMRKALLDAINTPPSAAQLMLPKAVQGPVARKALIIFGDELLAVLSLRQLPTQAKVTPKVLKVFGPEPDLMSPKARSLIVGNVLPEPHSEKRQRRSSLEAITQYFSNAMAAFEAASA